MPHDPTTTRVSLEVARAVQRGDGAAATAARQKLLRLKAARKLREADALLAAADDLTKQAS
jgi:hypothetical protein